MCFGAQVSVGVPREQGAAAPAGGAVVKFRQQLIPAAQILVAVEHGAAVWGAVVGGGWSSCVVMPVSLQHHLYDVIRVGRALAVGSAMLPGQELCTG